MLSEFKFIDRSEGASIATKGHMCGMGIETSWGRIASLLIRLDQARIHLRRRQCEKVLRRHHRPPKALRRQTQGCTRRGLSPTVSHSQLTTVGCWTGRISFAGSSAQSSKFSFPLGLRLLLIRQEDVRHLYVQSHGPQGGCDPQAVCEDILRWIRSMILGDGLVIHLDPDLIRRKPVIKNQDVHQVDIKVARRRCSMSEEPPIGLGGGPDTAMPPDIARADPHVQRQATLMVEVIAGFGQSSKARSGHTSRRNCRTQ